MNRGHIEIRHLIQSSQPPPKMKQHYDVNIVIWHNPYSLIIFI
jgi:hypothetical protein